MLLNADWGPKWNSAPKQVKFVAAIWLVVGVAGTVNSLISVPQVISAVASVREMTTFLVSALAAEISASILVILSAWRFVFARSRWARKILVSLTWTTVAVNIGSAAFWLFGVLTYANSTGSKIQAIRGEGSMSDLIIGIASWAGSSMLAVMILRALRSPIIRQYVLSPNSAV